MVADAIQGDELFQTAYAIRDGVTA